MTYKLLLQKAQRMARKINLREYTQWSAGAWSGAVWILANGAWNDSGIWIDTKFWIDG